MKTIAYITTGMALFLGFMSFSFSGPEGEKLYGKIQGTVIEQGTGTALPFANVYLTQVSGTKKGCITDFNGKLEIDSLLPGTYDLHCDFVGYESKIVRGVKVNADKITFINIEMPQSSVELEQFEVMEYSVPVISRDNVSSGATIKSENMSTMSGRAYAKYKSHEQLSLNYVDYAEQEPNYFANESYAEFSENEFKSSATEALSTFSIDVDAASYANVRRYINSGNIPPKDAVRIEEMINYFSYDYPNPKGEHPFSIITEVSDCPWNRQHQLVHVGLQGKKIEKDHLPPSNLVFLIDVSGSMSNMNKLPLLKKSFTLLVNQLRPEDKVAIVVYAGAAGMVLESTPGNDKNTILNALNRLNAGGSTAGGDGIKLAYQIAQENFIKDGNNRVILATDGDFNVGVSGDDAMQKLIEEKRKSGVFITVLGFGMGNYKDSKMERIADYGNGNYAYIDNIMEAKKVFVNEIGATMFTIAKDVKIQVEFNPGKIAYYKLIGYENRVLADRDFNDDTKDAGELGAGHTVTALYEVVPVGVESSVVPSVDPLKYQKVKNERTFVESDELLTVKFRYKDPEKSESKLITHPLYNTFIPLDKASDNFKFSAAVAEFGLLLKDSKYKASANYEQVVTLAKSAKGKDEFGYRAEFIRLVETMDLQANK